MKELNHVFADLTVEELEERLEMQDASAVEGGSCSSLDCIQNNTGTQSA